MAIRTVAQWFVGNFLLHFKDLVALLTLVLVNWHCSFTYYITKYIAYVYLTV